MKRTFKRQYCIFTLLLTCLLLLGCHHNPPVADFANHNRWDPAKQQRWEAFQQIFEAQYYRLDPIDEGSSRWQDLPLDDGPHPTQSDLDHLERRRTGDPHATSCRRAVIPGRVYDSSDCSASQLAAELFQEDEENHDDK